MKEVCWKGRAAGLACQVSQPQLVVMGALTTVRLLSFHSVGGSKALMAILPRRSSRGSCASSARNSFTGASDLPRVKAMRPDQKSRIESASTTPRKACAARPLGSRRASATSPRPKRA